MTDFIGNNTRHSRCALIGVMLLACTTLQAQALDPEKLFTKVSPSVVEIIAVNNAGTVGKQGSGVVFQDERVITNCHVLTKTTIVFVKWGEAKLVATLEYPDVERDLCQLKVPSLKAPAVAIAPEKSLRIGQRVYAIGNPKGLELTLSEGLISSFRTSEGVRYIQTTADYTHGSSGGGLFDDQGRLVGVTTLVSKEGNLNFAVPAYYINELPTRGKAEIDKLFAKQKSAPTSSPNNQTNSAPSEQVGHMLSGEEILEHYSRFKKLISKEKKKREFSITLGDDGYIWRDCVDCHISREDGSMKIDVATAQVCFDWNRTNYPTSGCFTLEQIDSSHFRLHLVNGDETIAYTAQP
jgi:serine protease Do